MAEFPPPSLQPLIQEVFELLKARNETISVAETVCALQIDPQGIMKPNRSQENILKL